MPDSLIAARTALWIVRSPMRCLRVILERGSTEKSDAGNKYCHPVSKLAPGYIVFEVVQDSEEPTMFSVYEEFVDQAAFDSHQNRVLASSWIEATKNVVRHYKVTVEESI